LDFFTVFLEQKQKTIHNNDVSDGMKVADLRFSLVCLGCGWNG
jgi:hypothetical protein